MNNCLTLSDDSLKNAGQITAPLGGPLTLSADGTNAAMTFALSTHKEILSIKRPWLQLWSSAVVRVTDEEWDILLKAYPDKLKNADSKASLTFMGPTEDSVDDTKKAG